MDSEKAQIFPSSIGLDMSSGPISESVMWKLRQAVLCQQAAEESHMVKVAPLALATWATWFALLSLPLLRIEVDYSKTTSLMRILQERTAQVIGACALMQDQFLQAPYPGDLNPTDSYEEFISELDNFPVIIEVRLTRAGRDFKSTVARYTNVVVEMFDMMGKLLDDRWMLKVADMAAEASYRCMLSGDVPLPPSGSSHSMVVPGARRDRATTLAHPVMQATVFG